MSVLALCRESQRGMMFHSKSVHAGSTQRYGKLRDKLGASLETDFMSDGGTLSCKPLISFA